MPITCPHCGAIFDSYNDICPSCSRPMWKTSWWMTLLKAIFRPKRTTMRTATRRRAGSGGLTISKSLSIGKPVKVKRSQRIEYHDGSGTRTWSSWDDVPPEIRAEIVRIQGGQIPLNVDIDDVSIEDLSSNVESAHTIEIRQASRVSRTIQTVDGADVETSSSDVTTYRYTDGDGNVRETDRVEDLPEHVQEVIRHIYRAECDGRNGDSPGTDT